MKTAPIVLLSAAAVLLPCRAQQPAVSAEVCGVQVVSNVYPASSGENSFSKDRLVPFNAFEAGTAIAFLLNSPGGGLTNIDLKTSRIETFSDDKGTMLWDKKDQFKNGFGAFPKVSPDGKAGLFTVEGKVPPASDASSLIAKGTVSVTTASKKSTAKAGPVALKKGTPVKAGALTFAVENVNPGGSGVQVDLKTTDDLAKLVEIRFLGPDGKPIKADKTGTSSFSAFGGPKTSVIGFELETKLATVAVEVETWDDLKTVKVPFTATVELRVKQ